MRKTLTTAALLLALSCPAWAGIMHTPDSPEPQPAPSPANVTQEPTAEVPTEGATQDSCAQIVLELLAVLPSLL
jgi:hypothetical protein